eukprot:772266_1
MQRLVTYQLGKVFSTILKNFHPDMLQMELMNGCVELQDVVLNCEVLDAYVKLVVPWLHLKSVSCSFIQIQLPSWTRLRKDPVVVKLGTVRAIVAEQVAENSPVSPKSPEPEAKSGGSYGITDQIVDGLRIEIEAIQIRVELAPVTRIGPDKPILSRANSP